MTQMKPLGPFADGRGADGRFSAGNPGGPGNPHAAAASRLRAKMLETITGGDVELAVSVIREVMTKGKDADRLAAARELLDRSVGKPLPAEPTEDGQTAAALADVDLRNLTPDELRTLRNIIAAACHRAGHPVGNGDDGGN
jgi:hypothetical protein